MLGEGEGHYVGKKRQGEEGKSQDAEVWMVTHCLFPEIKKKKNAVSATGHAARNLFCTQVGNILCSNRSVFVL